MIIPTEVAISGFNKPLRPTKLENINTPLAASLTNFLRLKIMCLQTTKTIFVLRVSATSPKFYPDLVVKIIIITVVQCVLAM